MAIIAANKNYNITAGQPISINFVLANPSEDAMSSNKGGRGPSLGDDCVTFVSTYDPDGKGPNGTTVSPNEHDLFKKRGYFLKSSKLSPEKRTPADLNNNIPEGPIPTTYLYCKPAAGNVAAPVSLDGWCFWMLIKFTSAYGPASSDPNKMYYVGKPSTMKITQQNAINQLHKVGLSPVIGVVNFYFKGTGTSAYQVNVNKAAHALGPDIGNREEGYGMPFTTAEYEIWGKKLQPVRLLYGTLNVNGGLSGGDSSKLEC